MTDIYVLVGCPAEARGDWRRNAEAWLRARYPDANSITTDTNGAPGTRVLTAWLGAARTKAPGLLDALLEAVPLP